MNVVEAMRKGKEILPKAEEISEQLIAVRNGDVVGMCAFGAMAVGRFGVERTIRLSESGTLLDNLSEAFPQLQRQLKRPVTKLYKYIWYLNDKKGLTINQIADTLDKRGLQ